jgi:hypothetical protein
MRKRRTQAELEQLRQQICEIAAEIAPCTVRQLYYQLVCRSLIEKTEAEYKAVVRLCTELRIAGRLPWNYLTDHTRWVHQVTQHSSMTDALQDTQKFYRRDLWGQQLCHCEVWIEKDALSGVFQQVTEEYGVELYPCRGYPSITYLHSAAASLAWQIQRGKYCHLYYFGDLDPTGQDIPRNVSRRLQAFTLNALIDHYGHSRQTGQTLMRDQLRFRVVAVTQDQVECWNLPGRPTKQTDSRAANWSGESVELDAIHPDQLRRMTRELIEGCIDPDEWKRAKAVEQAELQTLADFTASYTASN